MAEIDTGDRASRFDRADFGARSFPVQRQTTPPSLQEPVRSEQMRESVEPNSSTEGRLPTGDERITADHLTSSGWSQAEIQKILGGPPQPDAPESGRPLSLAHAEAHLRSLGWTQSDIARLLVGPDQSHLTAESLFRQHVANPEEHQEALVKAMDRSGAQNIKPDRALLAGLDAAHLSPESPTDIEQIISQFAELPDVQKKRFLLLLDSQKRDPNQTESADGSTAKKGSTKSDDGTRKTSTALDEALPIVKSGLDLLNTALKGLLGSTKDGKTTKGKGSAGKDPLKDFADDLYDTDETSDLEDEDEFADDTGYYEEDSSTTIEEGSSSSDLDDSMDLDSESVPD